MGRKGSSRASVGGPGVSPGPEVLRARGFDSVRIALLRRSNPGHLTRGRQPANRSAPTTTFVSGLVTGIFGRVFSDLDDRRNSRRWMDRSNHSVPERGEAPLKEEG